MNSVATENNPLAGFLLRRWASLGGIIVLAGMAAAPVAMKFAKQTHTCGAVVLYSRTPLGAPHYQPPEVQAIVGLFRSRDVLDRLAREESPPPPLPLLAASIDAESIMGSNSLQLTMRADDELRAKTRLDRLMHLVISQAAELRRSTVSDILVGLQSALSTARTEAEMAYDDLLRFNRRHRIATNLEDDLDRLRDDIGELERLVDTDRPTTLDPAEALQRRRAALLERVEHRRNAVSRQAALDLKKNEYERAAGLHAKQYISDAEFRRIEIEYRALADQHAESLEKWTHTIAQLDDALTARTDLDDGDAAAAPPVNGENSREVLALLQKALQQRRSEVDRLNELRPAAARLTQQVETTRSEARRIESLVAGYNELIEVPYNDLTIMQPAGPTLVQPTSNKKKLFLGAFAVVAALLTAPLFLWDFVHSRRFMSVGGPQPVIAGLPCIAGEPDSRGDRTTARREAVRMLALRMQQIPSDRGVVVALNSLEEECVPLDAALCVAECLQRRGEHVLIVETTGDKRFLERLNQLAAIYPRQEVDVVDEWNAAAHSLDSAAVAASAVPESAVLVRSAGSINAEVAPIGLAEFLANGDLIAEDVIVQTPSFDAVTVGCIALGEEAFAARRFTTLLDECRTRYGVVLVLGPGIERAVDLEMLAARVDALAFVIDTPRPPPPGVETTIHRLTALRANVLGVAYL